MFPHVPACNPHHTVSTTWPKQEHIPQKPHYTNSPAIASGDARQWRRGDSVTAFPYFSLFFIFTLFLIIPQ
jgi:hypothetical protein